MATFRAFQDVDMFHLDGFAELGDPETVFFENGKHYLVGFADADLGGEVFMDLKSSPAHPFTYNHAGRPTGGMISAITVDVNTQEQFKFTGLDVPIVLFEKDIADHDPHAAVELALKGNDRIVGSSGDDVLLGGAGHNIFSFRGIFGKDRIVDFSPLDKIAFAFAPNFDDYTDVLRNSHISDGELMIVDPNNPNNVTTIHGIDEKHDLRPSELLFFHH